MGAPVNIEKARDLRQEVAKTYGKGRQGRHSDVPGIRPEVVSYPKYYQNDDVIRIQVDFILKF